MLSVDPGQVTTAVVLNEDGTTRSVPMKIVTRDGVAYAAINSLSNSTYALVSHRIEFADMASHWAKASVNAMGSRMVISGMGDGRFEPDRHITRAEFAAVVVRALGMKQSGETDVFADVSADAWYRGSVGAAYESGLLRGFEDGTFRPDERVTREQAMTIVAKALDLAGVQDVAAESAEVTLQRFADASDVSAWAKDGAAWAVRAAIVTGRADGKLDPQQVMTRAETATIVERLLKGAGFI